MLPEQEQERKQEKDMKDGKRKMAQNKNRVHAKMNWCPNGCSWDQPLIRKNISETHAIKGCPICRCKIKYIRTDTKEGRAERTRVWLASKGIVVKPRVPGAAITPAERMRRMRARLKAAANIDGTVIDGVTDDVVNRSAIRPDQIPSSHPPAIAAGRKKGKPTGPARERLAQSGS